MRRRCAGGCGKSMRGWDDYCRECAYWHNLVSPSDIPDDMEVSET